MKRYIVAVLVAALVMMGCGPTSTPVSLATQDMQVGGGIPAASQAPAASQDPQVGGGAPGVSPGELQTAQPLSTEAADAACMPREGLLQYVGELPAGVRICFVYPQGFEVVPSVPGIVSLTGPARGDGPEAPRASLTITTLDPAGASLDVFVEQEVERAGMGLLVKRQSLTLDGAPAVAVEGLPGQVGNRVVYAEYHGVVYYLMFAPLEPGLPEATGDMEALYRAVMGGWVFN